MKLSNPLSPSINEIQYKNKNVGEAFPKSKLAKFKTSPKNKSKVINHEHI